MARKTYEVKRLVEKVNSMIAATEPSDVRARETLATVLESVLFETDNYRGYTFLKSEWTEDGTLKDDADFSRRVYSA